MKAEDMTIEQLKAAGYDTVVQIENLRGQLNQINALIVDKQNKPKKKEEVKSQKSEDKPEKVKENN